MASTFTLAVGLVLLGITASRVAAALRIASAPAFLIAAFVIAHAELLLVALGLSIIRAFTAFWVMTALAAIAGVALVLTRGRRSGIRWRAVYDTVRSDRVLIALAVIAALGF